MDDDSARRSAQVEAAADAVLEGKQLLIDLDRRSNATREAQTALRKLQKRASTAAAAQNGDRDEPSSLHTTPSIAAYKRAEQQPHLPRSTWLQCNGGTFVKFSEAAALQRLEVDQKETLRSIDEARDALKDAVAELARLEGPDSALAKLNQGFDLKAVRS